MGDITALLVVVVCVYFFYKFLDSLVRRKERIMLIDKIQELSSENVKALQAGALLDTSNGIPNKRFSSLRMGLLLTGIGLGLLIAWGLATALFPTIQLHRNMKDFWEYRNMFTSIFISAPATLGGVGLVISYLIEQKNRKQEK